LAYIKDQTGKYILANAYFEDVFQRPASRVVGLRDMDLLPPEQLAVWQEHDKQVLLKEIPLAFTETTPGPDGPRYWLSYKFPIYQDDAPTVLGGISVDITYRVKAEQELETQRQELRLQAENLQALNTTLKVLLDQRDQEKKQQITDMLATLERLVFPYLERLGATKLDQQQKLFVELLLSNLKEIATPFASRLSSLENKLTPMELEVADLLKRGKTTTEIAQALHVSEATVSSHRSHIRDKLGLRHGKVNLKAFLRSVS
ncbi:MAG: PAS domain-containing protein, partial [Deltaproteobacteria bacterium]|nr:PAS domain-containing protein [Deltaproteobacteria bacterium]